MVRCQLIDVPDVRFLNVGCTCTNEAESTQITVVFEETAPRAIERSQMYTLRGRLNVGDQDWPCLDG
ncbi:hypothetical protein DOTSEDRAFT_73320 [Dothistroma septosporum NZE10]|uniref:Uncharacterized protein n=1 Tax=Dothistroma septosporum (strain NZE10 / CBS 128990) TaxID=675120 RepID=N1PLM1_DOTSN|nr:hypothetical protein DOTSEDRAFT_73320 [Dothistroma septosporum NZE10]